MASTAVDLIREKGAALPATALERFQAEQLAVLWEMHAKGCSLSEFAVLLNLAEKYDLDINAHEIWAAKGKGRDGEPGKLMILVGRDGLLTIARRQTDFVTVDGDVHREKDHFKVIRLPDGTRTVDHSYEGTVEQRGKIVGSWAMIKRRDGSYTNFTYCPWDEYAPTGGYSSPWKKQASAMMAKCSVSLALRIAYGISGVVGEDEVASQFDDRADTAIPISSLAAAAEDIPADLRDRFYAAYGEAADLRPGQVTPAAVGMTVRGQSKERIREFIESIEAANEAARAAAPDVEEEVEDAEVVPESDGMPEGLASLYRQLEENRVAQARVEEAPGDFEETSAELDRLSVEEERLLGEIEAAESTDQGRLL